MADGLSVTDETLLGSKTVGAAHRSMSDKEAPITTGETSSPLTRNQQPLTAGFAGPERRIFELTGHREHVWFWHVVGGEVKSYGTGSRAPWYSSLADAFERGLNQRQEQFFIRLSSNHSLEDPALAPVLEPLIEVIGKSVRR